MATGLENIRAELRLLYLPQALSYLNMLLMHSRGDVWNVRLAKAMKSTGFPVPPFLCHFLAKEMLLHGTRVGPRNLTWRKYQHLFHLYFDLPDPILTHPDWIKADPTAFFERFGGIQMPSQRMIPYRDYGLALSLYQDSVVDPAWGHSIRSATEHLLQLRIERFMQLGFFLMALTSSGSRLGTVTVRDFALALKQGLHFSEPQFWIPFLRRASSTQERFRTVSHDPKFRLPDNRYVLSEYNALVKYPVIEALPGQFIVPDPWLVVHRTTRGLFYDLFDEHHFDFTTAFGHALGRLVGKLLMSVYPLAELWSDCKPNPLTDKGRGDWVFKGATRLVLIECKSLRPSLKLTSYASEESLDEAASRIAEALEKQLAQHDSEIQRGAWVSQGLEPKPAAYLVVCYGQFVTVNSTLFRKRIERHLKNGPIQAPYLILSLEEFDCVIKLVELGKKLDELILEMALDQSFDVLRKYEEHLSTKALSGHSEMWAQAFLDRIHPELVPGRTAIS